jgi:hypothetical protein
VDSLEQLVADRRLLRPNTREALTQTDDLVVVESGEEGDQAP